MTTDRPIMKINDVRKLLPDVEMTELAAYSLANRREWEKFAFGKHPEPLKQETAVSYKRLSADAQADYDRRRKEVNSARRVLLTTSAHRFLEQARDLLPANDGDPNACPGLLLTGKYGSGKTTLATHFGREYHLGTGTPQGQRVPVLGVGKAAHVPVVYLKVFENMTTKQANQALAWFYDIDPGEASRYDITQVMVQIMLACRTRLMIVDDVDRLAPLRKRDIPDYLKDLLDALPVTFIFVHGGTPRIDKATGTVIAGGVETLGDQILERNPQFAVEAVAKGSEEWTKILTSAESYFDLLKHQPETLTQPDLAEYLWNRTQGWTANLGPLLRQAALKAMRTDYEMIDEKILKSIRTSRNSETQFKNLEAQAKAIASTTATPKPKAGTKVA